MQAALQIAAVCIICCISIKEANKEAKQARMIFGQVEQGKLTRPPVSSFGR